MFRSIGRSQLQALFTASGRLFDLATLRLGPRPGAFPNCAEGQTASLDAWPRGPFPWGSCS
eukprot:9389071-Alexandrium_andersonii.AAC.1